MSGGGEDEEEDIFGPLHWSCANVDAAAARCYHSYIGFTLTFRHRPSSILGKAFRYSPENAFYNLINKYISLSDICLTVHH